MPRLGRDDPRVGTVLSERYRIDALIGEGGMGKVYSAEHVMMKKRLAVKVLHRELTTVPDVVARFEREAMAAANIEHPNVAAATDFGKLADGSVFLVLEFVQGKNLRDEIAEGPIRLERALHIARQIAAGLGSAHAQGIVHRDLKPENVMLVDKERNADFVKVLDFGIAKVPIGEMPALSNNQDQPITRAGMVFGTPEYMAPEQALGQTVDGRADLYALGVILFEMLAGMRPFSSQSPVGILGQQLAHPPPAFAERAPFVIVPPAVEQIVHKLLARDRDNRYSTAAELVSVLDVLLAPAPNRGGYRFTLADGSPSIVPDEPGKALPGAARSPKAALPPPGPAPPGPVVPPAPALPGAASALSRMRSTIAIRFRTAVDTLSGQGDLATKLRAVFGSLGPRAEGLRERLPEKIRNSLRPVPTRALVIAGGLSAFVVLVLALAVVAALIRLLFGGEEPAVASKETPAAPAALASAATPPSSPPVASASAPELERAIKEGPAALEALAERYPSDPLPRLEAARAWVWARDFARATAAVQRVLQIDPGMKDDQRVAGVLFQTAQARPSADASFALLTGTLGGRGAEVLWDLAADPDAKLESRQRAGQWLRTPAFRKAAPESLLLAADLRTVKTCDGARALLSTAKLKADARSLSQLEAWQKKTGCGRRGRDDCMPCLRKDGLLEETIAAIRARTNATP